MKEMSIILSFPRIRHINGVVVKVFPRCSSAICSPTSIKGYHYCTINQQVHNDWLKETNSYCPLHVLSVA
jgi:hypothetical protein